MVDTLQALTRLPNLDIPSLRHAISKLFGPNSADLLSNIGARLNDIPESLVTLADRPLVTSGDVIETIDELVKHLLALLNRDCFDIKKIGLPCTGKKKYFSTNQPLSIITVVFVLGLK